MRKINLVPNVAGAMTCHSERGFLGEIVGVVGMVGIIVVIIIVDD